MTYPKEYIVKIPSFGLPEGTVLRLVDSARGTYTAPGCMFSQDWIQKALRNQEISND